MQHIKDTWLTKPELTVDGTDHEAIYDGERQDLDARNFETFFGSDVGDIKQNLELMLDHMHDTKPSAFNFDPGNL